jgi:hypothetical protein
LVAIAEQPPDRNTATVLADALLADGEPWGELISVMATLETTTDASRFVALKARKAALLAEHRERWLPGFDEEVLQWRWGLLERATVRSPDELSLLLESPLAIALRGLTLETRGSAQAFLDQAVDAPLPGLRAISIHCGSDSGSIDARRLMGRGLSQVAVAAEQADLGPGPWPALHALKLYLPAPGAALGLRQAVASAATEIDFRQLALGPDATCGILESSRWPMLRAATIENDETDALCRTVALWPLVRQLDMVTIIGPFTTEGVDALLMQSARLSRLRQISLEGGRCDSATRRLASKQLPQLSLHKLARRPVSDW